MKFNVKQSIALLSTLGLMVATADAAVLNGGFESPAHTNNDGTDPDNWTVIESGVGGNTDRQVRTRDNAVRTGQMALQLGAGNSNHDGQLWQAVSTSASQQYTFGVWARAFNTTNPGLQDFTAYLRDGSGTGGSILATISSSGGLTTTWQEYTVDFTALSGTTTIHIIDAASAGAVDSNDTVLDDVSLTAVPEPSSLALLGLSGLMLVRRRR